MIKKSVWIAIVLATMTGSAAVADSHTSGQDTTGLGVIFGEPTGFTGKFWLQPDRAIDAGVAFSFSNFVDLYGDYLFHFPGAFGRQPDFSRSFMPYVGVGGELFVSENTNHTNGMYYTSSSGSAAGFGIRIPVGLECVLRSAPIGIFAELVPGVGIVPSTFGFLQGGVGARYYF